MTLDGQLVLHHDDTLDRVTTGTGNIKIWNMWEYVEVIYIIMSPARLGIML